MNIILENINIFKIKFNNLNIFVTYILIIHNLNYLIFLLCNKNKEENHQA